MKIYLITLLGVFALSSVWADDSVSFWLSEDSLIDYVLQDQQANPLGYETTTHILRRYIVEADGDIVRKRIQSIWYYPNTEAVEDYGTETLYFNAATESVKVFMAATVKPDASVSVFDAATVQYGDSDQYNTFSDAKVAYLALPGLTANGYAVMDYEVTTDYRLEETAFADTFWAESYFPLKHFETTVHWQQRDMAWSSSHPKVNCTESESRLHCVGNDIAPIDIDESTFWRDKLRGLQVAEQQPWTSVAQHMRSKYQQAFAEQTLVDSLYQQLTEGLDTRASKIDAIHRYVSEQIRYVSLSTQGHSHTPHTNDSVIRNRYGDCKDKTALLHALLERLGIEATPRLVATSRTDPNQLVLPTLAYFNHIVLCIDEGGQEYCLDPTDTDTHWQTTSDWLQNKVSLPLMGEAKPTVIAPAKYRWQLDINTKLYFTEDGGLKETQTRKYLGEYAAHMRYQLRGEDKDEQLDMLKDQYQTVVADIDAIDAKVLSGLGSDYESFVVESTAEYDPFAPTDAHLEYSEPDSWIVSELDDNKLENEFDPVVLSGVRYVSRYEVDVSEHWVLRKPTPNLKLSHRFAELTRESGIENGKMTITTTLSIPHQTIAVEDQQEYNELMNKFRELQRIRIEAPLIN